MGTQLVAVELDETVEAEIRNRSEAHVYDSLKVANTLRWAMARTRITTIAACPRIDAWKSS
jgi:hypothetical protein